MNWNNSDRINLQNGLIDGHVHLSEMEHPGRVVENAVKAGVKRMVAVAMNLDSCRKTLELADRFSDAVLPAIGFHPWSIKAEDVEDTLAGIVTKNAEKFFGL